MQVSHHDQKDATCVVADLLRLRGQGARLGVIDNSGSSIHAAEEQRLAKQELVRHVATCRSCWDGAQ